MSIITLILFLALVGFMLYLILTYVPMAQPFKQLIVVVVVIALILWLVNVTGLLGSSLNTPIRFH